MIQENLTAVIARIENACRDASRNPKSVSLLAVSKTKPIEAVQSAYHLGLRHFGENYLQDALPKVANFPAPTWHFIGQIQSNKTRDIAAHFDVVHGVASEKIASRLNAHRPQTKPPLGVFLQVNLVNEASKGGVSPETLPRLIHHVISCEHLTLLGLMGMPPASYDLTERSHFFQNLRALQQTLKTDLPQDCFTELSMGMSDDLEVAIAAGATWIRVGSALFGDRSH